MLEPSAIAPETLRPIRRAEYDRMVEAGLFSGERIELLRGALVAMSPQSARHADVCARLTRILDRALGDRAEVRCQLPFSASDDSEPEPDVAVYPPGDYRREHPGAALLVVEVAESSLRKDRLVKAALYAEANVPEYWIIDLVHDWIDVMTGPAAGGYACSVRCSDRIRLSAFPDVDVRVADLLGG
jgi:Uma2 family endonuclease